MLSIICEVDIKNENNIFGSFKTYSHLKNNDHIENVKSNLFYKLFIEYLKTNIVDLENNHELVKKFVSDYISNLRNDESHFDLVSLAISCIQLFVQVNWLGPLPMQINPVLPKAVIYSQISNDKKSVIMNIKTTTTSIMCTVTNNLIALINSTIIVLSATINFSLFVGSYTGVCFYQNQP